jgi:F-type H+-transporting ATPase subunit b
VHEHITDDVEVEYEQFPDLVCGIELSSGGRRLSWNLADHLQELKARVDEAFAAFDPATGEVSGFAA